MNGLEVNKYYKATMNEVLFVDNENKTYSKKTIDELRSNKSSRFFHFQLSLNMINVLSYSAEESAAIINNDFKDLQCIYAETAELLIEKLIKLNNEGNLRFDKDDVFTLDYAIEQLTNIAKDIDEFKSWEKTLKEKEVEDTIFFKIDNIHLLFPLEETVEETKDEFIFSIGKLKENLLTDNNYRVDGQLSNPLGIVEYSFLNYKCHDELMHKIRKTNISDISELSEDEIITFENNLKNGY